MATRGVLAHPADKVQKPLGEVQVEIIADDGQPCALLPQSVPNGYVYTDGSADRHAVTELRRAAWAIAWFSPEGQKIATATGNVPNSLPQTPQAAEYTASTMAVKFTDTEATQFGDCLGTVSAMNQLKGEKVPRGVHAGLCRMALESGNLDKVQTFTWMRAHQEVKNTDSTMEKRHNAGNKLVDELAGQRRVLETDAMGDLEVRMAAAACADAKMILRALGELHALWPPPAKPGRRRKDAAKEKLTIGHCWKYSHFKGKWMCEDCKLSHSGTFMAGPPRWSAKCSAGRESQRMRRAEELGHLLDHIVFNGLRLNFCRRCGARGRAKWIGLLQSCPEAPPTAAQKFWLDRATSGETTFEGPENFRPGRKKVPKR